MLDCLDPFPCIFPPRDLFKKSFILIKAREFKRSMCVNSHRGDTEAGCAGWVWRGSGGEPGMFWVVHPAHLGLTPSL